MSNNFEGSEFFGDDEDERSPSEHFEARHSPRLGHTFIEKSLASLDAGMEQFDDEEKIEAEIYANVAVFREVMQYIEEFGIYLYSRLDTDVDFVEAITGTVPQQVKRIFESIRDGELDDVINEYQPDTTSDDWLKNQFGYDRIEENIDEVSIEYTVDNPSELAVDNMEEAISVSLDHIRGQLQDIAEFFLRFEEPYNAVKHGNRVYPMPDSEFTIEGPDGERGIELDLEFVSFLCKTTGDRRGGELYTFTAPVSMLRDQSVSIVKLTRNLYTHMYDIRQKVNESVRTGEEVSLDPSLYGVAASSEGGSQFSVKSIQNADTTIWLPENAFPDDLEQYELPARNKVAMALRKRGNDMVVETEGDRNPSYEYPILFDVEMEGDEDHLLGMTFTQNFSFSLYQLPLWQFLELRSLSEIEPIEDVVIEYRGESSTQHLNTPFDLPELPDPAFPEDLEYMRNVGRATDSEIWLPYLWPSGVGHVVEFYREEYELTRDVAQDLLDVIDQLTEDEVATIPSVGILDPNDVDDEGNYRTVEFQELRFEMNGIILEVDDDTGGGHFSLVPGSDPRYERLEQGYVEGVGLCLLEESPEELYELFLEFGLEATTKMSVVQDLDEANTILEAKREYGPKFTWYYIDKFYFTLFEDVPPHLQDVWN
jgi:hypothetical protein